MGGARGLLYGRILLRTGQLPDLPPGINAALHMRWGRLYVGPPLFTNKTPSDCQSALVEQKKRPRFPEPLKETNTDTPFMHNVYDRIGAMVAFAAIRAPHSVHCDRDDLFDI